MISPSDSVVFNIIHQILACKNAKFTLYLLNITMLTLLLGVFRFTAAQLYCIPWGLLSSCRHLLGKFCLNIVQSCSFTPCLNPGPDIISEFRSAGIWLNAWSTVSFCCHVSVEFCTECWSPLSRARLLLDLFQSSSFCFSFCFFP